MEWISIDEKLPNENTFVAIKRKLYSDNIPIAGFFGYGYYSGIDGVWVVQWFGKCNREYVKAREIGHWAKVADKVDTNMLIW